MATAPRECLRQRCAALELHARQPADPGDQEPFDALGPIELGHLADTAQGLGLRGWLGRFAVHDDAAVHRAQGVCDVAARLFAVKAGEPAEPELHVALGGGGLAQVGWVLLTSGSRWAGPLAPFRANQTRGRISDGGTRRWHDTSGARGCCYTRACYEAGGPLSRRPRLLLRLHARRERCPVRLLWTVASDDQPTGTTTRRPVFSTNGS